MSKKEMQKLEVAFANAVAAVKAGSPEYQNVAPEIRRRAIRLFSRNFRAMGFDRIKAWNATLEELGGEFQADKPETGIRRRIAGEAIRKVSEGISRRHHKKAGNLETWKVKSIDAWRDTEGGWYWNNQFSAGEIQVLPDATKKDILAALRTDGFLTSESKGRVIVEGTEQGYEIQEKSNRMPILFVEDPGEH